MKVNAYSYNYIISVIIAVLFGTCGLAQVRLVEEADLEVRVQPLLVVGGESGALPAKTFVVTEQDGGSLALDLRWPDPSSRSRLRLQAVGRAGGVDEHHFLRLTAWLDAGNRTHRASRVLNLQSGSTSLFEVHRVGDERLTLAITVERKLRRLVPHRPSAGVPLTFKLEVEGVRGEEAFPLETNHLQTFLGEPVEYAFRRGEGDAAEAVTLMLTPILKEGDVIELRVDVSGSLPGGDRRLVLSRGDVLLTSRGATSTLGVTAGDPPAGYRFRITPDF